MPDHKDAPDPMDRAYVEAEAMLDDAGARAARRARVLTAVAGEQARASAVSPHPKRRAAWGHGGWLAAASVAGLSALIAFQVERTNTIAPQPQPPQPAAENAPTPAAPPAQSPVPKAAAGGPAPSAAPSQAADAVAPEPRRHAAAPVEAPSAILAAPVQVERAVPPPSAPAPPPPPPPAPAPVAQGASELAITGSRLGAARAPSAFQAPRAAPEDLGVRLRAAAATGRVAEIGALLDQGAAVDAPDEEGETPLMKAVRANQPEAAALLRRRGASLELRNRAGQTAQDLAGPSGSPTLDRALGLTP